MEWLRGLDAHPKTRDEFRVRTLQGGISTLVALVLGVWLVRCELRSAWSVETRDTLYVNSSHGAGVTVSFEIEFPNVACELIGVDAMEQSGQPMGFGQKVKKMRLEKTTGKRVPYFASSEASSIESGLGLTATQEHHFTENASATQCGDCYGAQDDEIPCCTTCDEVRRAYRKKGWTFKSATVKQCQSESTARLLSIVENGQGKNSLNERPGCVILGDLRLPAVSGNFHFAPGRHVADLSQHRRPEDLVALTFAHFNVSHKIIKLNFLSGHNIFPDEKEKNKLTRQEEEDEKNKRLPQHDHKKSSKTEPDDAEARAKRAVARRTAARKRRAASRQAKNRQKHKKRLHKSQLEGEKRIVSDGYGMHQYYLKVVPTRYNTLDGHIIEAAQYSVTEHLRHVAPGSGRGLPGVFFFYEVSPVCAEVVEHRDGLPAFLTGLSAIVGGVYVTFGILDRALTFFTQSFSDGKTILTPRRFKSSAILD